MTTAFQSHPALAALGSGRCLIIGEVALTHDGSLGLAHAFIDAIAAAGADAVKFQTHIAAAESTPAEPFRVKFSRQDATRYDYWKRMEFTEEQWRGLAEHARERGVLFISSPFSVEAVDLLERVGMPLWKIASGETSNPMLLDRIARHRRAGAALDRHEPGRRDRRGGPAGQGRGVPVGVFQCTTAYPCPPEKIGLNLHPRVPRALRLLGRAVRSLGDHLPGPGGERRSASTCSKCTSRCSREMFGPDVVASVTTTELRQLVEGVRFIERMRANPVDKEASARETAPLRELFTRSLVARADLPAGTVLTRDHLAVKKPGTGLSPERLQEIIGRRLARPVTADQAARRRRHRGTRTLNE